MLAAHPSTPTLILVLVTATVMLAGGIAAGIGIGLLIFGRRKLENAARIRAWRLTIVGVAVVVVTNIVSWSSELFGV